MSNPSDEVKAFWRDADLWIFSVAARTQKLLTIFGGLLFTAIGIYLLGKSVPEWPAIIISCSTSSALALGAFAVEMYHKGGTQGLKLKAKSGELQKSMDDTAARRLAARTFTETKQALGIVRNFGHTAVPKPTTEGDYGGRVMEFTLELRRRTVFCLELCNERTAVVPNASLEVASIKSMTSHVAILRSIDDSLEMIETIQKTL